MDTIPRTHNIKRDDMIWHTDGDVAIHIKDMNNINDWHKIRKKVKEILKELS